MSTRVLPGKYAVLPKGKILEAQTDTTVHIYVCRENTTYIEVPKENDDPGLILSEEQECLLRLPAHESDIPGIVALVASRAARRRRR